MRDLLRRLSSRTIYTAFAIVYGIAVVMAIFPPAYLAFSGIRGGFLGAPFSIWYWIIDAAIVGFALWALYAIEDVRGDLDEERPAELAQEGSA